jgi:hypothetical protein
MAAITTSVASHVKRSRSTRAEVIARRASLAALAADNAPSTVRNIYYRAVVASLVPKTEAGYAKVQRDLAEMRKGGQIPYQWIVDNTRVVRGPNVYSSVEDALRRTASFYRRDLWAWSEHQVEVWTESDSVAGVVADVVDEYALTLMAVRGFSSMSFTYSAAQQMNYDGRPARILYIGDHDPAGIEIEANLRRHLDEHLTVPFDITRIGVTWDQVEEFDLPGTAPKKPYGYPLAVEAEALPAPTLRALLEAAVVDLANSHDLEVLRAAEQSERQQLLALSQGGIR